MHFLLACVATAAPLVTASPWDWLAPAASMDRRHMEQGTGANHSMSHGSFNFTPSGIEWPGCPRKCCNAFFEFFPHPVNHPLCVSADFFRNVTTCVAKNCTAYEQGAFAVVAEIECPAKEMYPVNVTAAGVVAGLKAEGGAPQACKGVDNSSIVCENGTSKSGSMPGSAGLMSASYWITSVGVLAAASLFAL